jgi:ABC-type multidrug transport system fused ATPase/permease subunit
MNVRANELGLLASKLNIESNEKIVEALGSYREVVVSNRRGFYTKEIGKLRFAIARTLADLQFMPYVSKYVIETGVLLGALFVGCAQFALQDTGHAAGTLAIFLAAGTRLAPAILRIQQNSIQLRGNSGMAKPTLDLIDELESENRVKEPTNHIDLEHIGFNAAIEVENISFSYPNGGKRAIADFSIKITPGSVIAIVGPSGAGKSTLADLILGVLTPDKGSISISGLAPLKAVEKWPGSVAYIPQDVMISAGTIRQNVAFGYPSEIVSDEMVNRALTIARLESFVSTLPQGLNSNVGERGVRISGGQRQRLGIARAIFTNPGLLVFDEATSSLDAETEEEVAKAIFSLKGKTTIIMIAHRLSTVRTADVVLYINEGCVIANGTFNEVRMAVPDFDTQARLMGL